ncbi:ribonuclease P [Salipiger aestuarii]|nr:ribonuclease P protein component [Salipiger aestuarii]KAA8609173.1 ribonuclease P [Salipiger aestuarii]
MADQMTEKAVTEPSDAAFIHARTGKLETLRKRPDFLAAARAKRAPAGSFMLQARNRNDGTDAVRVGFTCSKKVGNAVARNRAKRRLREIARMILPTQARPGWDYVLIGWRDATANRPFDALQDDLEQALRRIHSGGRNSAPDGGAKVSRASRTRGRGA